MKRSKFVPSKNTLVRRDPYKKENRPTRLTKRRQPQEGATGIYIWWIIFPGIGLKGL